MKVVRCEAQKGAVVQTWPITTLVRLKSTSCNFHCSYVVNVFRLWTYVYSGQLCITSRPSFFRKVWFVDCHEYVEAHTCNSHNISVRNTHSTGFRYVHVDIYRFTILLLVMCILLSMPCESDNNRDEPQWVSDWIAYSPYSQASAQRSSFAIQKSRYSMQGFIQDFELDGGGGTGW